MRRNGCIRKQNGNKSDYLITYEKEVAAGDTVWSICSKIATDKEDMGKLVWQVMKDNHIENPGALQPGTELVIRVKAAREL